MFVALVGLIVVRIVRAPQHSVLKNWTIVAANNGAVRTSLGE
jgi:hypothetical protein